MSSVAPPLLTAASGASLAQAVELSPGDVIKALVLSLIKDTTFRLQLPTGIIDIQTDSPLVPGTRVELAVGGTQDQPTITLTPLPDNAGASRSGLATQASAQTGAPIDVRAETPARIAPAQADNVAQAAATIVRDAATRQGGIAQLYADLEASFGQAKVALPAPVAAAAQQLFALRLDATSPVRIDADAIKVALAQSGLAANLSTASDMLRPSAPLDVRAVLLSLREALKKWENAERSSLPQAAGSPANAAPGAAASTRPAGPALPYPNGPTVPQPAADSSLPANATARDMALHLLDKTDSAIAREMLLKIASLPDRADMNTKASDTSPNRMTFDMPLATAMGTTVAQLRIERDAAHRTVEGAAPVWRASFSVDLEPIGAVHVRIALIGGKATVSFNAERPESAKSLTAGLPSLEAGLRKAELEPGVLSCQAGQPVAAAAGHGLYVDHAS